MNELPISFNFGVVAAHSSWMRTHLANMQVYSNAKEARQQQMMAEWQKLTQVSFYESKGKTLSGDVKLGGIISQKRIVAAAKGKEDKFEAVMVVPIRGMMIKEEWRMWGCTSTKSVRRLIAAAEQHPNVVSIVFAFDSGGGMVDGNFLLSEDISNCSLYTVAHVDGMCASAAYQAASQCEGGIYVASPTDYVGSIGVYQTHVSFEGFYDNIGFEYSYIVADGGPNKVVAPSSKRLSDEDREKIIAEINPLRELMVAQITEGRAGKLKPNGETLSGSVFTLSDAKKQGLVDGRASITKTITKALRAGKKKYKKNSSADQGDTSTPNSNVSLSNPKKMEEKDFLESLAASLQTDSTPGADTTLSGAGQKKVQEVITALATKNNELTSQVTSLSAEVETLKGQISASAPSADVTALEAEKTELAGKVTELETKVSDLEASADENKTKLEEANTASTEAKEKIEKLEATNKKLASAYEKVSKSDDTPLSEILGDVQKEGDPKPKKKQKKDYGDLSSYAADVINGISWG